MKKVVFLFNEKDDNIPNEYSAAMIWWYGILENMGYDVMYYDYQNGNFNIDTFISEIKDFSPDFVIHGCYSKLHTEFVKLQGVAKVFIIQSDDDYRFHNYAKFWIPIVDGIISFCGSREGVKKDYYSCGCTEQQLMHGYWAFNPNTMAHNYRPERTTLVSHMGGIHGDRVQKIQEFANNGIGVEINRGIQYEFFKEKVSKSRFTLAFTMDATLTLRQLKGRIFELPYSAVLVAEPFPDMETYYDIGKEIIVFNTVPGAVEQIRRLSANEPEYLKMLESGRRRLLANHTCYHVWDRYILPKMDEDYKPLNAAQILKEKHGIII